jgi:hypothetical protein
LSHLKLNQPDAAKASFQKLQGGDDALPGVRDTRGVGRDET